MRWRTGVTLVLIAVLLVPVFRDGDGVPLSSYPMYATPRSSTVEFVVAVTIDAAGNEAVLPSSVSVGTRDPLIAETFLRREIAAGRESELCLEILERGGFPAGNEVEIRAERHRVVDRAQGRPSLVEREILAACTVSRL